MGFVLMSCFLVGCCYCKPAHPLRTPTGTFEENKVAIAQKDPSLSSGCAPEVPELDATSALVAWKKNPRFEPGYRNFGGHVMPSRETAKPGGHIYHRVPGLPRCAYLFCPFRPGCYEQIVDDGRAGRKKGNDEDCVDLQACEYEALYSSSKPENGLNEPVGL